MAAVFSIDYPDSVTSISCSFPEAIVEFLTCTSCPALQLSIVSPRTQTLHKFSTHVFNANARLCRPANIAAFSAQQCATQGKLTP